MDASKPATQFAPAERASAEEVQGQSGNVAAVVMLRQLLDAVPEMLMVLNDKRQIVFVNQNMLDHLSLKEPKAVYGARTGEVWNCVRAKETEGGCGTTESCRHCGAVLAILASQQGKASTNECRIATEHPGKSLCMRVKATPLEIGGRQFTLFAAADISPDKRRQSLERVLFGDVLQVSREIKTAAAELRQAPTQQLENLAGTISRFSDRLLEGVNEHRILLAAEHGGDLRVQPIPLYTLDLLQRLADFYGQTPMAAELTIALAKPMQNTLFTCDQTLLKLVLGHMVRNALEASQPQQTVTLGSAATKTTVEFSVHNPTYMAREAQLQVFQRGYTTKGEGRGLGTYAMRLLSERYLKGTVSFVSSPNIGTTFRAAYPLILTA